MSKTTRIIPLLAGVVALCAAPAMAFHRGGVADCAGCHTMHNSENGAIVADGGSVGVGLNQYLLKGLTPSDTCLECHAGDGGSYHVLASDPLVPTLERGAGDFVFLTENNVNDGHGGATSPILGYTTGHNIVAPAHGIAADPVLTIAPGGSFSGADLGCSSCHDPHGNTSFRMLYTSGQKIHAGGTLMTFPNAAPVAQGLALGSVVEANNLHTAYQSGMSAWCANCHGAFHNNQANFIHPSGTPLGSDVAAAYNAYNGTSDCIANPPTATTPCGSGQQATAYLALVPFEDSANTTTTTGGPTASSTVMCLTCHRAHATSAPNAGRWDFNVTFLKDDGVASGSYALPNPYDSQQRSLCNKCHSKDEFDTLQP